MNRPHALIALIALTLLAPAARADDPAARGFELLDKAVALRQADPDQSAQFASDAAAMLRTGTSDGPPFNPQLQRALGNAALLAGDTGHAVLAYRRAVLADPTDTLAVASLTHARTQVAATLPGESASQWRRIERIVRANLPRAALFWSAVALACLACWTLAARLAGLLPRTVVVPAATALCLSVLPAAALTADHLADRAADAVVLTPTTPRTGPDNEVYPPSTESPVPAGAEVTILETRDAWSRCALGSTEGWLPSTALERVRP